MEQEILNALKRIETKLDYPNGVPPEKLILYDIQDLMEITDLGYNKIWNFFRDKEKYPNFPGFRAGRKYQVEAKKFNEWYTNFPKED